jgi:hypothetical protein
MGTPRQPNPHRNESVEDTTPRQSGDRRPEPPQEQLNPVSGPDGDSSDQDIDTAGTEADDQSMTAMGPAARRSGAPHPPDPSYGDATENARRPIGAQDPSSMHRRENDAKAFANSSDVHDQPDPGSHQH